MSEQKPENTQIYPKDTIVNGEIPEEAEDVITEPEPEGSAIPEPEADEASGAGEPATRRVEPATDKGGEATETEGERIYIPEPDPNHRNPYYDVDEEELELNDVPRERKVRKKSHFFRNLFIVVIIVAGVTALLMSPLFTIKKIKVQGNSYYTEEQVVIMSGAVTGGNIIRGKHGSEIKSRLMQDPYFENVKVGIRLPGTLVIKVKEREQRAAIVYGSSYVVIDKDGIMLREADIDPEITLIRGLTLNKMEPGQLVEVEESATLTSTLEMLEAMKKGDFFFKSVNVSSVIITANITDTLLVKGTPSEVKRVIESGDLQKVVNRLYKDDIKRGTITVSEDGYISFSPNI